MELIVGILAKRIMAYNYGIENQWPRVRLCHVIGKIGVDLKLFTIERACYIARYMYK